MTPSQAYGKVRRAISSGVLIRPNTCNRCGEEGKKASDGRATIHAHHHDYSKPLDVEWVCAKCHREETPLPAVMGAPNIGEKNGFSKLTESLVIEIRNSKESSRVIAARLGVEKTTIIKVRSRELWKHVAASPACSTVASDLEPTK